MPTELIRKAFLLTEKENEEIEKQAKERKLSVSNLTRKLYGLHPLVAGGKRQKKNKNTEEQKES